MRVARSQGMWPLVLSLVLAILAGAACVAPCKSSNSESARRELARDDLRCQDQARKLAGNIDLGDYRSCMRVRGWCEPPD
jgi:hypothetical protein